jgi:hypothetical protein
VKGKRAAPSSFGPSLGTRSTKAPLESTAAISSLLSSSLQGSRVCSSKTDSASDSGSLRLHARSRPPPPRPASECARHLLSAFAPDKQVSEISFFCTPYTSRNCNTPIRMEKEDQKFLKYAHIITEKQQPDLFLCVYR